MTAAVESNRSPRPASKRRRSGFMLAAVAGLPIGMVIMPANALFGAGPTAAASPVSEVSPFVGGRRPLVWDVQQHVRTGGAAHRFELDDPDRAEGLSAWYYLTYVLDDVRLRVYEHHPPTIPRPDSSIAKSENVAWHVATSLLGRTSGIAEPGEIPDWARPRTGNIDGPSAGLILALAELDALTAGRLAGNLRVTGTGAIGSDGAVTTVTGTDVKLAAARLAHADVFFAPSIAPDSGDVTVVETHQGIPTADGAVGDWLNTAGYEHAGRMAASDAGTVALVQVSDIRQALAWLCGRTDLDATCALAEATAMVTLLISRPYGLPGARLPAAPPYAGPY